MKRSATRGGFPGVKGDDQGPHTRHCRYRCFLPDLAEFTASPLQKALVIKNIPAAGAGGMKGQLAERVGFEPTVPCDTHEFQSCTIGLSVTSPISIFTLNGGEQGIRTLGGSHHT